MERVDALIQVVRFGDQRELAYLTLARLPFDSSAELLTVTKDDVIFVLNKFLAKEITADQLEEWANFIECREDLAITEIEDFIYALANPELMGEIGTSTIDTMLKLLKTSSLK